MVRILPQHFFENPDVKTLLADGHACILHKQLSRSVRGKEGFVSEHGITFVQSGRLRVESADGHLLEVPEGKMVLFPKGIYTVTDIFPARGDFEAVMFFLDKATLEGFVKTIDLPPARAIAAEPVLLKTGERVNDFIRFTLKTYQNYSKNASSLTTIKLAELLHLLDAVSTDGQFAAIVSNLNNRERRSLRDFMEVNFSKPLSIEDYAYLTGRSVSSFRRDFKEQFGGVSPKQWLIDRRLERAATILARSESSISEVVLETGYDNVPHFIKAFHQKYGLPPKQFALQKRKELLV